MDDATIRDRIVASTLLLIADEGLDAVRHRRVAEHAGVSLGSTSYHFASRDDLIEAAFVLYLDSATALLDELTPTTPLEHGDQELIVDFIVRLLEEEFRHPRFVLAEYELLLYAARHESLAVRSRRWEAAQRRSLAAMLEAVGAERADDGARTLIALIRGIELERLASPKRRVDVRGRVRDVVSGLVTGSGRRS